MTPDTTRPADLAQRASAGGDSRLIKVWSVDMTGLSIVWLSGVIPAIFALAIINATRMGRIDKALFYLGAGIGWGLTTTAIWYFAPSLGCFLIIINFECVYLASMRMSADVDAFKAINPRVRIAKANFASACLIGACAVVGFQIISYLTVVALWLIGIHVP